MFFQIDSGMNAFRNGQTISSGWYAATAASISWPCETTSTLTSWPCSVRAMKIRWDRLLWAETRKRIRRGFEVGMVPWLIGSGRVDLYSRLQLRAT